MTPALLVPAALGLLVLAAGPLIAHLTRRQPSERTAFGLMLLLQRVEKRLRRRRRITERWLMLLRMAIVAAVVLAVTQPELRRPGFVAGVGGSGSIVLVIDNSLSMNLRQDSKSDKTLLQFAQEEARSVVRGLPDGARVGLVTIGGEAIVHTAELTEDVAVIVADIDHIMQTQGGTDLRGGVAAARKLLGGTGGEVLVFSDEAGSLAIPEAKPEISLLLEQGGTLVPHPVSAKQPSNVAVLAAEYGDGPEGGSVRVSIARYGKENLLGEADEVPLHVLLPDGTEINAFANLQEDGTGSVVVTVPRVTDGGVAVVRVDDEQLTVDNDFAFHLPRVGASRVLVVDGDPGPTPTASEVYFLERALAPWGGGTALTGGLLPDVTAADAGLDLDPETHRVVFLANVTEYSELAPKLVDFVRRGGGLVLGMGGNVTADRINGPLGALLPSPLRRPVAVAVVGEVGVPIALPDAQGSLFRAFQRGGRLEFGRGHVRQLYGLEPYEETDEVKTWMRLEGGLPLLVERRVGRGSVLLFASTFDLGWSDFPLQAAFMPWVQSLVQYLGGEAGGGQNRQTGLVSERVSVPLVDTALGITVRGPLGAVPAQVRNGAVHFVPTSSGAYVVETPGAPPLGWVAVNTDPAESDVRRTARLIESMADVDPEHFMLRTPLARWLLGLALLGSLLQGLLLVWLNRRRIRQPTASDVDDLNAGLPAARMGQGNA